MTTDAMLPVFENAGQAICLAYTIMGNPAQQECPTRLWLIRQLSEVHLPSHLRGWLKDLMGTPSETVNFRGLKISEIRAQCALVLSAVNARLPGPELWAIQAQFAVTDYEDLLANDGTGRRVKRYAFSPMKAEAIQKLSQWLLESKAMHGIPLLAMDCMVAKYYAHHPKTTISFRELEQNFGMPKSTFERAFKKAKANLAPLTSKAIERMRPYFEETGLIKMNSLPIENTA